jgi:propanediol dehydratase small subunit
MRGPLSELHVGDESRHQPIRCALPRRGRDEQERALRLFTIAEADDADVKRELVRINKLHLQARSRLAELEGRRAVSAQFEPMAERVTQYCELMRDRLNDLSFEQKRDVLEALQAQFTLDKEGELRIVLVLPSVSETSESYTTLRRASA